MNLTTEMDQITERLIRGEISQAEALERQRKLLNAEIPETTTTETSHVVSTETLVEGAIAKYEAKKFAAAMALKGLEEKFRDVQADKDRITGAIAAAESKSRILAGSPSAYRSEKADMIARGLLGEKVDMTALKSDAEEFSDNISAHDLAIGIKALRSQLQDVERRRVMLEADKRRHSHEFFEAHARVHGIRLAHLATQLVDSYCHVRAAHQATQGMGNTFSTLAPETMSNLHIVSPLPQDVARECGVGRSEWQGRFIEQTAAVQNAARAMYAEMTGGAA